MRQHAAYEAQCLERDFAVGGAFGHRLEIGDGAVVKREELACVIENNSEIE
jgi:hypothetical protein